MLLANVTKQSRLSQGYLKLSLWKSQVTQESVPVSVISGRLDFDLLRLFFLLLFLVGKQICATAVQVCLTFKEGWFKFNPSPT